MAIGLISLLTGGSCARVTSDRPEEDRFAQWCENRSTLTRAAGHTVDVLLEEAGTQDCQIAEERLTNLSELNLKGSEIEDVTPLSSLTHLVELHLGFNRIEDVTPLSYLKNLKVLNLEDT